MLVGASKVCALSGGYWTITAPLLIGVWHALSWKMSGCEVEGEASALKRSSQSAVMGQSGGVGRICPQTVNPQLIKAERRQRGPSRGLIKPG